jgi:outer membrane protein assembly factor BamB
MKIRTLFLAFFLSTVASSLLFGQSNISRQWPQFRGYLGQGILDGASIPDTWDIKTRENILWKIDIPGLAHSCPVVWGDFVFLTSAVGSPNQDSLKIGLYGDIDMSDDLSVHQFKVYCINKRTGKIIWERVADESIPKERRHTKSTYANPTPATDGTHLVVSFGSQGLFCYNFKGDLLWKKDLGNLATGPFNETGVEWGYASSPVIHNGKVIIQADILKNSFLATYDIVSGNQVWKVQREAISSWGTPAVYQAGSGNLIVLNAYPFISAVDFATGREVWKIGNVGDAPAPTAIMVKDLVYINSAHGKFSPILAIRKEAEGDLTLPGDTTSSDAVAWSIKRGGAYMASPLVYRDYLYNMQISGQLTCLDALTGKFMYRKDIGKAFSASGIAADGKLYFTAETGEILVVKAGPEYILLSENHMQDNCMATPALSNGMILIRTQHSLVAVGAAEK